MVIFQELDTKYVDSSDRNILEYMNHLYMQSITINLTYASEADLDHKFYSGDQSAFNSYWAGVPGPMRKTFIFNKIRKQIDLVSGNQRKNRKQTICVPVENADQHTADQFSKIFDYIHNREYVLETISDTFKEALISGMSLLQIWLDFRSDPISGDIKVAKTDYNSFIIDPFFRNSDLSDCHFIWKRSYLTKRDILSLMPSASDIIKGLQSDTMRDGKFQYQPESLGYNMSNLLAYDEFYYRDFREQTVLVDRQTGEVQEWRGQDDERLGLFLQTYPQVYVKKTEVPTVKLAIVAGGQVLYNDYNPLGVDNYPFVPVTAYYNPQIPYYNYRVQGMVRGLRDAQFLYNRRKAIELDVLESQINSGWKYKEDALVNPADIFMSGQGKGLALKAEAQMTDAEQIQSPIIPPTTIQLSELMGKEMNDISGISEELLGTPTNDVAGLLSMIRQNASLVTLQPLFDQLDRSQRQLGKLMIDVIQANYTPGKIKKILGGDEPSQQFYNKSFGIYNAHVEEAVLTQTQKQLQFAQLIQLREMGVAVPDDVLLDSCLLQNKEELIKSIQQSQEQKSKMEQQSAQLQMMQLQSQIKLNESQATANEGLGIERLSRVQENEALAQERRAQAVKDEDAALLDLVKAMKEIDGIDLQHMQQLLEMHNMVKAQEADNANGNANTTVNKPRKATNVSKNAGTKRNNNTHKRSTTGGTQVSQ